MNASTYQLPPQAIVDLVDAAPTPFLSLDPARRRMVLMHRNSLPSIAEVARHELRLAGMRIDPATNGPSRVSYFTGYTIRDLGTGVDRDVQGITDGAGLGQVRWSADGSRFAFTAKTDDGLALWVADVESGAARPITEPRLNAMFGAPVEWVSDADALLVRLIPEDRGSEPEGGTVPTGPVVQENTGQSAPARTYQDLLKNSHDEALFDHYGTSELAVVTVDGVLRPLGISGIIRHVNVSPDGQYVLVERIKRPYSYLVRYNRFAHDVEVYDLKGELVRRLAQLPLAESVPIAHDAVGVGVRGVEWRCDADAELYWAEAQDEGDPGKEAEIRDRLFRLAAPFEGDPEPVCDLGERYIGMTWGTGDLALVTERWWKDRHVRSWRLRPDTARLDPKPLIDRSFEDRYNDPGSPLMTSTGRGTRVILTLDDGGTLLMSADGASPEGDRPFLDRLDIESGTSTRLMRSDAPSFERPLSHIDAEGPTILMSRERPEEPTNYLVRNLSSGEERSVTDFPHPYPGLAGAKKEMIRYERADGVGLTASLHTPPGYSAGDGPLPTLLWAYPREFRSADAAGQVKDSPYRFARLGMGSPLYLLAAGYAVLDGPTMPIVGEGEEEPNDTYVEQLVAGARAAVEEVVRRGVADPNRIAVGGHSYGAFMASNLLAHSDLFRAGVAQSGAYNRTLTPFGFQAEERTFWEAPEVYSAMSPFVHADKISAPILLVHGEADNNPGTFPMQSERFYNALKGHGANVRLLMLPHESHGYRARESILHLLSEIVAWLGTHMK